MAKPQMIARPKTTPQKTKLSTGKLSPRPTPSDAGGAGRKTLYSSDRRKNAIRPMGMAAL